MEQCDDLGFTACSKPIAFSEMKLMNLERKLEGKTWGLVPFIYVHNEAHWQPRSREWNISGWTLMQNGSEDKKIAGILLTSQQ